MRKLNHTSAKTDTLVKLIDKTGVRAFFKRHLLTDKMKNVTWYKSRFSLKYVITFQAACPVCYGFNFRASHVLYNYLTKGKSER